MNTLPFISWTIEKDVKALTNKQLKMYVLENLSARDSGDEESPVGD